MHNEATNQQHRDSPLFWRFNCEREFLASSFLLDDLLREHNERFFFLTAQNQRICKDVWVSCIMFRLGQNERWNYIGMPTVFLCYCLLLAQYSHENDTFGVGNLRRHVQAPHAPQRLQRLCHGGAGGPAHVHQAAQRWPRPHPRVPGYDAPIVPILHQWVGTDRRWAAPGAAQANHGGRPADRLRPRGGWQD